MAKKKVTDLLAPTRLFGGDERPGRLSAPRADSQVPKIGSRVPRTASVTRSRALRVIYKNLLSSDPRTVMWPEHFHGFVADMLVTAKNEPPFEFHRVFRECKELASKEHPRQNASFLVALAAWLHDAQFTRTVPGHPPDPDWFVMTCTAEILDDVAPILPSVRANHEGLLYEDVPLYEVFAGLK